MWSSPKSWSKQVYLPPMWRGSFPDSSVGEESACSAGDPGLIPGLERSPGEGIGYPLQYSWASLVAQLVKYPPTIRKTCVRPLVGKIPWRREWLPTPVLWPGEFHWLCSPWGHKELDTTERLSLHFHFHEAWEVTRLWQKNTISGRKQRFGSNNPIYHNTILSNK